MGQFEGLIRTILVTSYNVNNLYKLRYMTQFLDKVFL